MKVTIIDSICGSGKTSWAIQEMNKNTEQRYIFITPFLDEVKRIKNSCDDRYFYEPKIKYGERNKFTHFKQLLKDGKNIVSTHSLFERVDKETYDLLKENNYTLILDEVMNVVEKKEIDKADLKMLEESKIIKIEGNRLYWLDDSYSGKLSEYKSSILNGDMYIINNTIVVWTFPVNIFECFKEVFVMTFLFKGQLQRYYYDMYKIDYEYKTVIENGYGSEKYKLIDYQEADRTELRKLINIYDGKYNRIGFDKYALSFTWYNKAIDNKSDVLDILKNNIESYFRNSCKETLTNGRKKAYKNEFNCWTVPKSLVYNGEKRTNKWTVLRNSKNYLSWNIRATNEYRHKINVAYCVNLFLNPIDKNFFISQGVKVNEDIWALGEMIQFIFRTQIRDNKPINLYLPSSRMRKILTNWLND